MPPPSEREIEVFNAALELPILERVAYLDYACADDPALRQHVEELLRAGDKAGAFLESPAPPSPGAGVTIRRSVSPTEKPGDRIGRYKLLQQIGEGGCGVVYMAEQEEPVRRRVALKVIKLGMDTKSVIARFEAERQALALMDHPNIAKVLDAGATDTGRPYFVMELVHGIKITDYCDENNLPTHERLDLFVQVCRAIQHAHQKGVIHRDIKPSNILVTLNDGVPMPKVIDFGIAKATHGKLTDQTLFTAFEQFIGTPAYMSPEQAEMNASGVDTRSDIYSLGVLLYEFLTGQTPFDSKVLLQSSLDEIRRVIREKEPVRPSTRLSTMLAGDLTATAHKRRADPPRLIHLVRGDLDWIVLKALEKDRNRRYETANGLGVDVQRYLHDEPVLARPPSQLYLFQKLIRRNKLAFAAAAAVLAALVAGLGFSTYLYVREKNANRRATSAEKASRIAAANSEQVAHFLQDMIEGVGPEAALGRDTQMMREILDRTEQRMGIELKNQPEVEAKLRMTIGGIYDQLSEFAKAEAMCREAIRLREASVGTEDGLVAQWLDHLGFVQGQRGDFAGAETSINRALEIEKKLLGDGQPAVNGTLVDLAGVLRQRGNLPGAKAVLSEVLGKIRKQPGPEQPEEARVLNDLGLVQWSLGDLSSAEASFQDALRRRKEQSGPENPEVATALGNLGLLLWERGNLSGAEAAHLQALAMEKKILGAGDHTQVSGTLNNLALVLRDEGDLAGAETNARQSLAIETKLVGPQHPDAIAARKNLALILRRHGAQTADPAILREAIQLSPTDPLTADALACLLASPSLTTVASSAPTAAASWHYTATRPPDSWASSEFQDADWQTAPVVSGFKNYLPRSARAITTHTNLWLRRSFEIIGAPPAHLAFRVSRDHGAQIFINGIPAAAPVDWTDADVLVPCSPTGRAALKPGANLLAIHCQDADGSSPIEVGIFQTQDPGLGRIQLLDEFSRYIAGDPQRAELYSGRASVLARLGRWPEAATDLAKAIELDPTDAADWCNLAPVLLQAGDLSRYELHRQAALNRFASPDSPVDAGRIAILAFLRPEQGDDLEKAVALADMAGSPYPDGTLPWRQFAKGLADFRQGRHTDAIDSMRKTQLSSERQDLPGWSLERQRNLGVSALLVKAMACDRSNQNAAARAAMNEALALFDPQPFTPEGDDTGRDWPGWLIAHLLMNETRLLLPATP